ncbi:PREDICTED: F-box protein At2g17690 [Tarenaya hassleriana]|uniref:F-box protein At2g17690 n=1 Tax=Tarenaya hassleriana TaxID=28532 RepID=UPI00053CA9F0|nr:PREDICTED: F-box protein At2g17690 [Tarenaya hassleriana]
MSEEVNWSELPEELLQKIAVHLFSDTELISFRSVCRTWRSSAADKRFPSRRLIRLSPLVHRERAHHHGAFLSRATYFRVTLPLASVQRAWMIKVEELESGKRRLLSPLSRLPINHSCQILDLLKFGVSEIEEGYAVKCFQKERTVSGFQRVAMVTVAGETQVLGIGCDGKLRYWNGEIWIKIKNQADTLCDITVHRGITYVIDINGIVWWLHSFGLVQYSPPLHSHGNDKSFVESRGELYVVDRFMKGKARKGRAIADAFRQQFGIRCLHAFIQDTDGARPCNIVKECEFETVSFKVYKLDEEWGRWMEVKSLGDRAFVMATDCCFSVSALEFNGCLENSIYFTDEDEDEQKPGFGLNGHDLRVFKLDDGSITYLKSFYNHFQMFFPSFLET